MRPSLPLTAQTFISFAGADIHQEPPVFADTGAFRELFYLTELEQEGSKYVTNIRGTVFHIIRETATSWRVERATGEHVLTSESFASALLSQLMPDYKLVETTLGTIRAGDLSPFVPWVDIDPVDMHIYLMESWALDTFIDEDHEDFRENNIKHISEFLSRDVTQETLNTLFEGLSAERGELVAPPNLSEEYFVVYAKSDWRKLFNLLPTRSVDSVWYALEHVNHEVETALYGNQSIWVLRK